MHLICLSEGDCDLTSTTGKPERLQEYLAVGGLPDLTDEEVLEIDTVGSTFHYRAFVSVQTALVIG